HAWVSVVVSPADYVAIIEEMQQSNGAISAAMRFRLAVLAFEHTCRYDGAIAMYLGSIDTNGTRQRFPDTWHMQMHKRQDLRYGENPHQQAAFYVEHGKGKSTDKVAGNIASEVQLQGKALSFNNIADTDAALECVKSFSTPACVIVKHANPCGVAIAATLHE